MQIKHLPYVHPYKTIAVNSRTIADQIVKYNLPNTFLSGFAKIMISDLVYPHLKNVLADGVPIFYNRTDFITRYIRTDTITNLPGAFFDVPTSNGLYIDYMYLDTAIPNTSAQTYFQWGSNARVLVDGILKNGVSALIFEIPFKTQTIELVFDDSIALNSNEIGGMELSVTKEKEIYNDPNIYYDNNNLPKPIAYQLFINSSEIIPVSWTSEDNVYDDPIIANTDTEIMIIDKTRSFIYDPMSKTYTDLISSFSNNIAGDSSKFYAEDNYLIYEYDSLMQNWYPNGLSISFVPNFTYSSSQAVFARFPYNVINGKTITLDASNSVTINNSSITGSISGVAINYTATSIIEGSTIRYANNDGNNIDLLLAVAENKLKYVRITADGYKILPNITVPKYLFEETDVQVVAIENGQKEALSTVIKGDIDSNTILTSDFTFDDMYILNVLNNTVYFVGKNKQGTDYTLNLYFAHSVYEGNYTIESEPIILQEPIKIQSIDKGAADEVYVKDELDNPYYAENYFAPKNTKAVYIPNLDIDPEIRSTWEGTIVYVDGFDGDDTYGDGTIEKPFKTISKANTVGPNVIMLPGKYIQPDLNTLPTNLYALIPNTVIVHTGLTTPRLVGTRNVYNCLVTVYTSLGFYGSGGVYSFYLNLNNSLVKARYDRTDGLLSKQVNLQNRYYSSTSNGYFTILYDSIIYFDSTTEITREVINNIVEIHVPYSMVTDFLTNGYIDTLEELTLNPNIAKLYNEVVFVKDGQVIENQGVQTDSIKIVREFKNYNDISWSIYNETDSTATVDMLLNINSLHTMQGFNDTERSILMSLNGTNISAKVVKWFDETKIYVPNAVLNTGYNSLKYLSDETNSITFLNTDTSDRFKFEHSLTSENSLFTASTALAPIYDQKGVRIDNNILNVDEVPVSSTMILDFVGTGLGGDRQIYKLRFLQDRHGDTGEFWVPVEITAVNWDQTVLATRDINNIKFVRDDNTLDVILLAYDPDKKYAKWLVNLNHPNSPFVFASANTELFFTIQYDAAYTLDLTKSPKVYVNPKVSYNYYKDGINVLSFPYKGSTELIRANLHNVKFAVNELGTANTFTIFANTGTYHKTTDTTEYTLFSLSDKIKFNSTSTGFKCYVQTELSGVASFSENAHPFEFDNHYKVRSIGLYYDPTMNNIYTVLDGETSIAAFLNNVGNTMTLNGTELIAYGGNVFDLATPAWSTLTELLSEFMFFNYQLTIQQMRGLSIILEYDDPNDDVDFPTANLLEKDISAISDLITIDGQKILEVDIDGNLILSSKEEFIKLNTLNFQNIVLKINADNVQFLHPHTLSYETISLPPDVAHSLKLGNNTQGYLLLDDLVILTEIPTENLLKYIGGRFR
jgi:hypothetical protein